MNTGNNLNAMSRETAPHASPPQCVDITFFPFKGLLQIGKFMALGDGIRRIMVEEDTNAFLIAGCFQRQIGFTLVQAGQHSKDNSREK